MNPSTDQHLPTYESRVRIGFSGKDAWRDAPAAFDGHTLRIEGHPVMEDWEDGYMRELADIASANGGTVLEVGFGMGLAARYLQESGAAKHIVIEANREVYGRLLTFADAARVPVEPHLGFWEDIAPTLPAASVSGILFDTYPLAENEIHRNHFPFFAEAYRLLAPGGILTYYSDEATEFSEAHRDALWTAGFRSIGKRICPVLPPEGCEYWTERTLLAPIVTK
ncbi:MAG TPA: class I SAM-dependent methyltransferase [Candidatus Paceibacterota bacterium]|nr:class I SAM-dependent methyltransferase [Candidatus Paceibacterota bacterium]